MPQTSAEKSKRYREKLKRTDPERYSQMLKRSSERGLRRYREKNANLNEEQREDLRARWREDNKKYKTSSHNQLQRILGGNSQDVPSHNETSQNVASENATNLITLAERNIQSRVERNLRNENAKLRRTVLSLKKSYNNIFKKVENQQKQLSKMDDKLHFLTKDLIKEPENESSAKTVLELTPFKMSEQFVNQNIPDIETPKKESIKRVILEHNVLTEALKGTYKKSSNEDKSKFKSIVNSALVKKYKMKTKLTKKLGLNSSFKTYQTKKCICNHLRSKLTAFYEQDDVSRASAGKKECKTLKGCKKQKRYLLDTLYNLHKKYIIENGYIGLSTFKKHRPFYIVAPRLKDLETCACVQHSNMRFMINALKSCGILDTNDINEVIPKFACDTSFKDCMHGICNICFKNEVEEKEGNNDETSWLTYNLKEHIYSDKGVSKKSKKMVKEEKKGTMNELIQLFNMKMKTFKKHVFNVTHQYQQYKWCTNNLKVNEIALHIDFSENWVCKYKEEVQAMHFGSSKNQITLHTGVLYHKDAEKPVSFCSICPDNTHNPEAIWAHLDPVMEYIKVNFQDVTTIHFFSDGPTSQYRQKKNFYLFSHNIPEHGFSNATWNFFEASHGKGAADGIGGAIKRTLDFKVAHGVDIPDAETAFDVLGKTETVIKLFYVAADDIKPLDNDIVTKLTPLQQTMKVHQVVLQENYLLTHRILSCFCRNREGKCECYDPSIHKFELGSSTHEEGTKTEYVLELDENTGEVRKVKKQIFSEENDINNISDEDLVDFDNIEVTDDDTLNESLIILVENELQKIVETEDSTIRERKGDGQQSLNKKSTEIKRSKKCQYNQESSEENDDYMSLHDTSVEEDYLVENTPDRKNSNQAGYCIGIDIKEDDTQNDKKITKHTPANDMQGDQKETKDTEVNDMQGEKDITKDAYVLVKFNLEKRSKFYLGQVLEVIGKSSYKINFLRHKGNGKFAWPTINDVSLIYKRDIEQILSNPLSDRRGIKTFDLSKLTFKID